MFSERTLIVEDVPTQSWLIAERSLERFTNGLPLDRPVLHRQVTTEVLCELDLGQDSSLPSGA